MAINSSRNQGDASPGFSVTLLGKLSEFSAVTWEAYRRKPISYWILLVLSSVAMLVAFPASSLFSRLYYADGGKSKWIISWVAVAGWPLTALFLLPVYFFQRVTPTPLTLKLTFSYVVLGFLSAADNLMYAWAYAYLPASTASLLASSSLVFSALFGYFIVKNRLTSSSINSVVIITAAVALIALDSESDRSSGVSKSQYTWAFIWDILGSALHGLIFALSELVFVKLLGRRSFHVVLEQQVMVSFFGFIFTTTGVIVYNDFAGMKSEARSFKNGETSYYMVLIWAAITFQLGVLGSTAVLYLASTVLAGVLNAVRVPLTSIAAVIIFNDPMSGFKILALIITFWGFGSYIYGQSYASNVQILHYDHCNIYIYIYISSSLFFLVLFVNFHMTLHILRIYIYINSFIHGPTSEKHIFKERKSQEIHEIQSCASADLIDTPF